jgi:hypothetical protein
MAEFLFQHALCGNLQAVPLSSDAGDVPRLEFDVFVKRESGMSQKNFLADEY